MTYTSSLGSSLKTTSSAPVPQSMYMSSSGYVALILSSPATAKTSSPPVM